jgi:hypothetical protein
MPCVRIEGSRTSVPPAYLRPMSGHSSANVDRKLFNGMNAFYRWRGNGRWLNRRVSHHHQARPLDPHQGTEGLQPRRIDRAQSGIRDGVRICRQKTCRSPLTTHQTKHNMNTRPSVELTTSGGHVIIYNHCITGAQNWLIRQIYIRGLRTSENKGTERWNWKPNETQ